MKLKNKNIFPKKNFQNESFTLIELLVVMGIVIILSGTLLINYHSGERYFALQRTAQKIADDLNYAQVLATNSQEFNGIIPKGGYGVYFNLSFKNYYKLYADFDGNQNYNTSDGDVLGNIKLEPGIFIKTISSSPTGVSINFMPPDPIVKITTQEGTVLGSVVITLCIQDTDCSRSNIKNIIVNQTGLIEVK